MGKNKGLRAKKRAKEAQLEIVDSRAQEVAASHVTSKPNEQLFALDTTASIVAPQELPQSQKQRKSQRVSDSKVKALLEKHDAATLKQMATKKNKRKATTPAFDLWQDEEQQQEATIQAKQVAVKKKTGVAVDVAQSGQSYHPDPLEHQNVIGEALALELRRNEAQDYRNAPLSTGMSDTTKALLKDDDDDSSSDDEEEDTSTILFKQKQKLTRAQRNRQKRIRAEQKEIQQKKVAKKQLNAITEAKTVAKQLRKKEQEDKERKAQLQQLKQEQARVPGTSVVQHLSAKNPLYAPTLPVALTHELSGSLRTMQPKGSLLEDRMTSFCDRNMATTKSDGKRQVVQGNKRRRKLKVKAKGHDIHVKDESGKDYLLMG